LIEERDMAGRLTGKVAIVTGAGASGTDWGNGTATALLFAREGARLFLVDRDEAALETARAAVAAEGAPVAAYRGDVARAADVAGLVASCLAEFARIDVVDNNVGIAVEGGPLEASEESFDHVLAVNLKSVFLLAKHALPAMLAEGGGSFVHIASVGGLRWGGVPYISYAASKAALMQFSRHLGLQYARQGIRSNCVVPGLIDGPMPRRQALGAGSGESIEALMRRRDALTPTGRQGTPWDVAQAALFLASEAARYVNAAELVVDGGLSQALPGAY
jgi:NAD(P)-dependent dehydrogenase (short-subunit alcohol dehydrogenase family)